MYHIYPTICIFLFFLTCEDNVETIVLYVIMLLLVQDKFSDNTMNMARALTT